MFNNFFVSGMCFFRIHRFSSISDAKKSAVLIYNVSWVSGLISLGCLDYYLLGKVLYGWKG